MTTSTVSPPRLRLLDCYCTGVAGPPGRSVMGWDGWIRERRAADLVFDPTLACRGSRGRAPAAPTVSGRAPSGATRWHASSSSPPAPDSRGRHGQVLLLSRTMLSNHELPYVGRFACDWLRLATTDPHAAHGYEPTPAIAESELRVEFTSSPGRHPTDNTARATRSETWPARARDRPASSGLGRRAAQASPAPAQASPAARTLLDVVEHGHGTGVDALVAGQVAATRRRPPGPGRGAGPGRPRPAARTSTMSAITSRSASVTRSNRRLTWGCSASWRRLTRVMSWRVASPLLAPAGHLVVAELGVDVPEGRATWRSR